MYKRLEKHESSLVNHFESSYTLSTFGVENEKTKESKVLCELKELSSEHFLVKSAFNFTLLTLTLPPSQEKELVVDKSSSTSCDEDKGSALLNMLNDLENMSIEDLTNILSSTYPSLIP